MQIRNTHVSLYGRIPVTHDRARQGRQDEARVRPEVPGDEGSRVAADSRRNSHRIDLNASLAGGREQVVRGYQDARQAAQSASYMTRQAIAEYSGTLLHEERDRINQMLGIDVYA